MSYSVDLSTQSIFNGLYTFHYTADSFVNPDWFDYKDAQAGKQFAVVFHDAGFVLAIVWQGNAFHGVNESEALDAAVDSGKLDRFQITQKELHSGDYYCVTHNTHDQHEESEQLGWCEFEGVSLLGNASEPFDTESLDYFTVPAELFALDSVIINAVGEGILDDVLYQLRSAATDAIQTDYDSNDVRNDWLTYKGAEQWLEQHKADNFPEVSA